jgi:acetyl/propionyl-CoA carboxylase alpha subunit
MEQAIVGKTTFQISASGSQVSVNGKVYRMELLEKYPDEYVFLANGKKVRIIAGDDGVAHDKKWDIWVNGRKYPVQLRDNLDVLLHKMGMNNSAGQSVKELKAPMPGLVLDIMVEVGSTVKKDEPLLILEAMKMENVIKSPGDGVVKQVKAIKGKAVEKNDILITFE